jgi:type IV pilus assembly protein PilM
MTDTTLAIHLSDNSIKMCESFLEKNKIHIKTIAEVDSITPIFSNQSEKSASDAAHVIEELVNKAKIKKRNSHIIIPDNLTFTQILELPLLPEKELLSAVKYQAEQIIPMPIDQTALDISTVNEDKKNKKSTVLIVAAPINLINYITKIIEYGGLIVDVIENESSSFSRFITESSIINLNQSAIFFSLGFSSASLYFYNKEKNIVSEFYNINIGINLFIKELRIQTNNDNEKIKLMLKDIGIDNTNTINIKDIVEPIINEVSKNLLNFTEIVKQKYNYPLEKIFFLNQTTTVKNLENTLSQKIGIVCEPLIFPTLPPIPNPYAYIFSFASSIK